MISSEDLTERDLAAQFAPILQVDLNEPYEPVAMGYTIFRSPAPSPSSKFVVQPLGAMAIEYAIYYDWDIGHLYDLEHVWVHVGADGAVTRVEASSHGGRKVMDSANGLPEMSGTRPVIYAEAGKHAHWASPAQISNSDRQKLAYQCGPLAGVEGVHLGNPFAARGDYVATAHDHRIARLKMLADAFVPSHLYRPLAAAPVLCPWAEMETFIPDRVRSALASAEAESRHLAAVFLDCGDTLVDERTEVKSPGSEVVLDGDLIPGAREMVLALKERGHRLVLVADGPRQTFVNLLEKHQLWHHFDAHVISEDVGVHKPDARMFDAALAAAGLGRADAWRTVMVGNNLSRDIKGANALGITSVFMAWSTLRTHLPAEAGEVPDFRLSTPVELPALLDQLEPLLRYRAPAIF
jgi:phosphoglycolate phosphatase-like HAD superfamily hydrolase